VRAYAVAVAVTFLLHVGTIKWQPWGNGLLVYLEVLAAPLAGLWIDRATRIARATAAGRACVGALIVALAAGALAGTLAVGYGFPRRLVGSGSVLTTGDWETRFLRRPQWLDQYRWAADAVAQTGGRRVGLVQRNDDWEYPWWLLLAGHQIVPLQSVLPHHPPARPDTVDAVVCTGDANLCRRYLPEG
jgi:hypothetical protein